MAIRQGEISKIFSDLGMVLIPTQDSHGERSLCWTAFASGQRKKLSTQALKKERAKEVLNHKQLKLK
jgi:hypothetical protein